MKNKIFLFYIFLFNFGTRFWKLGVIPPLFDPDLVDLRLMSAVISVFLPFILYFFLSKIYRDKKLALLSAFIFSLLPGSLIEGRIVSLLVSPSIWLKELPVLIAPFKILTNFLSLISFDMLFFQNTTFYWGGIRETGIIYLSLLPFILAGIYFSLAKAAIKPLLLLLLIFTIISLNPEFPESRLIFLSLPIFSLIIAGGLKNIWFVNPPWPKGRGILGFKDETPRRMPQKDFHSSPPSMSGLSGTGVRVLYSKIFTVIFILIFTYEIIQFFHFYTVHYPIQVKDFSQKITEPF